MFRNELRPPRLQRTTLLRLFSGASPRGRRRVNARKIGGQILRSQTRVRNARSRARLADRRNGAGSSLQGSLLKSSLHRYC
jgi:hypothetical protein